MKIYVDNYGNYLNNSLYVTNTASLISKEELISLGCIEQSNSCQNAPNFIIGKSYWTKSSVSETSLWVITYDGPFVSNHYGHTNYRGIRPTITISKSLI